jgi:hypothetical protein
VAVAIDAAIFLPGTRAFKWSNYVLIAALCLGLSWLFQRGARGERKLWEGIARTGAFLIGIVIVADGARFVLDVLVVVSAVAVGLDLAAEHRARVKLGELASVWPVHQVARLDEQLAKLAAANVPALARGEHYRALLQFFGPYVPIELMVPVERAADARKALEA